MERKAWALRLEQKQQIATKNREARDKRSPQEQLRILDQRLGKDQGAQKERARLLAMIKEQRE